MKKWFINTNKFVKIRGKVWIIPCISLWYDKDYLFNEESTLPETGYEYDRRILEKNIKDSPIVEFQDFHSAKQLYSIFGDRWEEPFKRWFEDNFHFPVKTILK